MTIEVKKQPFKSEYFQEINFMLEHREALDFTAYEFNGNPIYIEEADTEVDLFRVELYHSTGEVIVSVASENDYDVLENVTDYFDTKILIRDIKRYLKENNVPNQAEPYLEYCRLCKEGGIEPEDAIVETWCTFTKSMYLV